MRISKVNLFTELHSGLTKIEMSRLGQLVIVAGKNGAGKSRLLSNINESFKRYPETRILDGEIRNLEIQKKQMIDGHHLPEDTEIDNQLRDLDNALLDMKARQSMFEVSSDNGLRTILQFVPKHLSLNDSYTMSRQEMQNAADGLNLLGVQNSASATLSKIQLVQDKWFNANHPLHSGMSVADKDLIERDYARLFESIKLFLNTTLDRDLEGDPTLFNMKIGQAKLSQGQIVLLQLCLTIYAQQSQLSDMIVFLDEPENHLHPEALLFVVDKLKETLTNGQIWIATHSINLLAHYEPSSIWYMENSEVSYAGNIPEKVLTGLIGNEEEISKLSDFFTLPAQMANVQFAFECLFDPISVITGIDDPQTNQIIDCIKELISKGEKIRVLDFGAGQGRLLSTIKEMDASTDVDISSWLDYYAFDVKNNSACELIISEVYNNDKKRYFFSEKSCLDSIEFNSFDLVIMTNVFHEIDPKLWLDIFNEQNIILKALKKMGILLIVEDQLIPVGEKAYQNGFLVFDKHQFKILFNLPDYKVKSRRDDRLRAHFIPANCLSNITDSTRRESIGAFNQTAMNEVRRLRAQKGSTKNGRLHAFWSQQLVNSTLVLSEFGTNSI